MRWIPLLLFLCIPFLSEAAVLISEVAWMGSGASANHEWIELQNTGSSGVDVNGWTLSDGMNLSIPLSGTVPAGAYVVLERTSDESSPGTAFLIYTGALVNTGATLTLTRADGNIEDQVAGGENWQSIGGDNVTKETAQYTTAGWVTGTPTPGAVNSGTVREEEEKEEIDEEQENNETEEEPTTPSRKSGTSETVRLILTDAILSLKIDAQKKGYVNQPIQFEVIPSGVGKTITASLSYAWNFGDGGVTFGDKPTHTFAYPGTYIVTVYGSYKRQEQLARHEITILPVALSVTKNASGDVQVNNDSPYEIDVSDYVVKGERSWRFPSYSLILPNQTVTLSRSKIGNGVVRVFDGEGDLVAVSSVGEKQIEMDDVFNSSNSYGAPPESVTSLPYVLAPSLFENLGLVETALASETEGTEVATATAPTTVLSTTSKKTVPKDAWPYLGLIIVILLGLIGTATKLTRNQSE